MREGLLAIDAVPWNHYRPDSGPTTDIPARLRALIGDDDAAAEAAHHDLTRTLLGDRPAPAAAPAAEVLARLLRAPAFDRDGGARRARALCFLRAAARAAHPVRRPRLYGVLPALGVPVREHFADPDPRVRAAAVAAYSALGRHPAAVRDRIRLITAWTNTARAALDGGERAGLLLAIGELGGAPRAWLDHPDPAARGCAALAPALAGCPRALAVLGELSGSPRAFDEAVGGPGALPGLDGIAPRTVLVDALRARGGDPARLLAAAVAALPTALREVPCPRLGALAGALFPGGLPQAPTPAQRMFAALLADHDATWDDPERAESRDATLTAAGLPRDREAWRAAASAPAPVAPAPVDTAPVDTAPAAPAPADPAPSRYDAADILVFEGRIAHVARPGMYFGTGPRDPGFAGRVVERLVEEYAFAGADFSVVLEDDLSFTLTVTGTPASAPLSAAGRLCGGTGVRMPEAQIAPTAAWCAHVHAWMVRDGRRVEQDFADGLALGAPRRVAGGAGDTPGYGFTFRLDAGLLPPGARLPAGGFTSPRVRDLR